uniref:PINc domain-containing protein n=1 Tax=Panagrellus redivivus TaxID=6233 RepID=A0A7E4VLY0_PANRE
MQWHDSFNSPQLLSSGLGSPSGSPSNRDNFISLAKIRLRDPVKKARLASDYFEQHVTPDDLSNTVVISIEAMKVITEITRNNLAAAFSTGIVNLMCELVHKVTTTAKSQANLEKLGRDNVVIAIDRLRTYLDKMMDDLGTAEACPAWITEYSLEQLHTGFAKKHCVYRSKYSHDEIAAHHKLLLFKGDLLRYRCKILNEPLIGVSKAYWMAFAMYPEQGIIMNQLAVVSMNRDRNDRIAHFFYLTRAVSMKEGFKGSKETMQMSLGEVTDKMLHPEGGKLIELFKFTTVYDHFGNDASMLDEKCIFEYFFAWFSPVRYRDPIWRQQMEKYSARNVKKMMQEAFLHVMNLTVHRQSHASLCAAINAFLCLTTYLLETDGLNAKDLVQLVSGYIFAIRIRFAEGSYDEQAFRIVAHSFLEFTGMLCSKFYDVFLVIGEAGFNECEAKLNLYLPALVVFAHLYPQIKNSFPKYSTWLNSSVFDFSDHRAKLCRLGATLRDYITEMKVGVEVDSYETNLNDPNSFVLPELILAVKGSANASPVCPIRLVSGVEAADTNIFKTFCIRTSIVYNLLQRMAIDGLYDMTADFALKSSDLSTFELFLLPTLKKQQTVKAVYPEKLVIDTNTFIDSYDKIEDMKDHKVRIVCPSAVLSELEAIKGDERKASLIRSGATRALALISKYLEGGFIQIYNFYGERKADMEITNRDVTGLSRTAANLISEVKYNNDDFIVEVARRVETILEPTAHRHGFLLKSVTVRKVVVISSDKVLRMKAREGGLIACGFDEFFSWYKRSLTGSGRNPPVATAATANSS